MVGFSETSSCQRVPVPRYLRANCQSVSPLTMRIEVVWLTARLGSAVGTIGDVRVVLRLRSEVAGGGELGDGVRGFMEARGMAAIVSG